MLIDTHCHLDFDVFESDLDAIIQRAHEVGVRRMVTISTYVHKFERLKKIVEKYESVFCSIGTHPNSAGEETNITAVDLIKIAAHPKVVAIGEVGLDYHYDYALPEEQKRSFLEHIAAARQTQLPLVIHARNADDDMQAILIEQTKIGQFPFILHCYSSGIELAKTGVKLGGYISFSGILTFKSAPEIREIAKIVPHDRLLVETDAPFLAPVPFRGQTNEPSFVKHTAETLAQTLNLSFEDVANITTQNAMSLFSKMH
ncbi:TatD family hydrolase [Bartonella tamiae]|uniref:TatD family hydrolase n=1 Tax=Bartonella tamiae Th239 TaxID=1094558 RepID=J1JW76_9HYPH|nr:TatD family hydrolase [Bartonella tamiae]EJF88835.1 TatD family hydrolase [Bartonella tamiae Th239]EJF94915.1 TatD family hydrolase [Bartonella tamiae Th307]